MTTGSLLRVLIIADDALARAGLAALLADDDALHVAGQLDAAGDLRAAIAAYQPDVLLWDLGWDPAVALERLAAYTADETAMDWSSDITDAHWAAGEPPVLALLADAEEATTVLRSGAHGLMPRDADGAKLSAALVAVARGLRVFAAEFARPFSPSAGNTPADLVEPLTPRELEVLQLVAEGLPNKSIARALDISEHTVKFHINALLGKLNASSRTEAVVRATRAGLIML